jgi:Spy/CpxP family protein refolding chaperone
MTQQQKAQQMQQQFLAQMDRQYKELVKYASQRGQEALLAKAVMWTLKDTAADNAELSEDEQYTLARRSVAFTTLNYFQQGLTPEQTWGALVGD